MGPRTTGSARPFPSLATATPCPCGGRAWGPQGPRGPRARQNPGLCALGVRNVGGSGPRGWLLLNKSVAQPRTLLDLPAQAKSRGASRLPVFSAPICFRGVGSRPTRREKQGPSVASVQRLSQVQSVACQQVGEGVSETTEPISPEPGTQRGQTTFPKPHSEVASCPHSAERPARPPARSPAQGQVRGEKA